MSLISIFFIPSFYYWVDWCAYLFIGPFNIDSFGCEVPELKGKEKKKTNDVGNVLSWLCFFKKRGPHLPSPGPLRVTQHTSPLKQLILLPNPETDIELFVQSVTLSAVPLLGLCGRASLNHSESLFSYLLNGDKDTAHLFMLFWGGTEM